MRLLRGREAGTSGRAEVQVSLEGKEPHCDLIISSAAPSIIYQLGCMQQKACQIDPCWAPSGQHAFYCTGRSREAIRGMQVDAIRLGQALSKQLFQRVVAATELALVHIDGLPIIVRITEVHNLDEEARQEAVSYHCYRGLVTPDTVISLVEEGESFVHS